MVDILWPIARDEKGEYIPIGEALRATEYFCPECNSRMIARLGNIRQHHFGHYLNNNDCCGESGYHFLAKHMLAFFLKQNPRIPYTSKCPRCDEIIPSEKEIIDVEVEKGIDGDRPDLIARLKNGGVAYGEIVYKHPLGEKLEEYRSKHLDLFVWFINGQVNQMPAMQLWLWSHFKIPKLPGGELFFVSDFALASHVCSIKPGSGAEKREKAEADSESLRQSIKSKMGIRRTRVPLVLWYEGRHGEVLYNKSRARAWEKGRKLITCGFFQSKKKPYLFYVEVTYGAVFVDFGGTNEVPAWEEDGLVYAKLGCSDDKARVIIDLVREVLTEKGIETRLSFYAQC